MRQLGHTGSVPPGHLGQVPGIRLVSYDLKDQRQVVAMTSPAATYLLPELSELSLADTGTRAPSRGEINLLHGTVVIGAITKDEAESLRLHHWLSFPSSGFQWVPRMSSPLSSAPPSGEAPVADTASAPPAETWPPLAPGASVVAIASRIHGLSGLSDEELAAIFKVTRETFNRWRSGALNNPTPGSRRRLGLVLRVLEEGHAHGVNLKDWLLNTLPSPEGLTPYELLQKGHIEEVAYLAAELGAKDLQAQQASEEPLEDDLIFGDDDFWTSSDLEGVDDDVV